MWGIVGGFVVGALLFLALGGMEICALTDAPVHTVPIDIDDPSTYPPLSDSDCNALVRDVNAAMGIFGGAVGAALGWLVQDLSQHWDKYRRRRN